MAKKAKQVQQVERWTDEAIAEYFETHNEDYGAPDMYRGASERRPWNVLQWAQEMVGQALAFTMEEDTEIVDEMPMDVFSGLFGGFPDIFWITMYRQWSAFDAIPHREYEELFRVMRGYRAIELMHAEVRDLYESLPDEVAVYRGGDARSVLGGLSWTLDYEVAEQFAYGHRGMFNERPVVLSGKVKKRDIAFATNEREEREIVVFDTRDVKDKVVMRVLETKLAQAA